MRRAVCAGDIVVAEGGGVRMHRAVTVGSARGASPTQPQTQTAGPPYVRPVANDALMDVRMDIALMVSATAVTVPLRGRGGGGGAQRGGRGAQTVRESVRHWQGSTRQLQAALATRHGAGKGCTRPQQHAAKGAFVRQQLSRLRVLGRRGGSAPARPKVPRPVVVLE